MGSRCCLEDHLGKRRARPDSLFERFAEGFHLPAEADARACHTCKHQHRNVRPCHRRGWTATGKTPGEIASYSRRRRGFGGHARAASDASSVPRLQWLSIFCTRTTNPTSRLQSGCNLSGNIRCRCLGMPRCPLPPPGFVEPSVLPAVGWLHAHHDLRDRGHEIGGGDNSEPRVLHRAGHIPGGEAHGLRGACEHEHPQRR